MATFKLVIGTKDGKSYQREATEASAESFLGKKIGDAVSGEGLGLAGYELQITGGSDYCGFPMRRDVQGPARRKIFAVSGVGLKKKGKGLRIRKTVAGNTIHDKTAQVNLKVIKAGPEPLTKAGGEEKKEEKKG